MDKREQLLMKLDRTWNEFQQSYAGLPDGAMLEPGVNGAWSVKDVIAHVTSWEGEAMKYLPGIAEGRRPPRYATLYGGIDAFNAETHQRRKTLPLSDVLAQQMDIHRRLIAFLATVPDDQLAGGTRFRHRLRLDTYGHYPKHAAAIRNWRQRRFATG